MNKWFYLILIGWILFLGFSAQAQKDDLFEKANQFYEADSYDKAIEMYDSLITQGILNADLFYNTGNAYFQNGDLGHAILNFKKALKINPGHEKAENNLKIAQTKTLDKIEARTPTLFHWVLIQASVLSPNGWAWLTVVFSFLMLLLIVVFRKTTLRNLKKVCFYSGMNIFVLFVLSMILTSITFMKVTDSDEGVVISKVVDVKSSPAENSETVFTLHEGTVMSILNNNGKWIEISVNQGNIGWISINDIEMIAL